MTYQELVEGAWDDPEAEARAGEMGVLKKIDPTVVIEVKTQEQLEQLAKREDLDTICAFDYVRMKKNALSGDGLKMADWHPALRGISEVPKMN